MTGARPGPDRAYGGDAPAKLNLGLAVIGRRDDGYHTLRSVFVRLALADRLEVRRLPRGAPEDVVRVAGHEGEPWEPADDLVLRAVRALRTHVARPLPALAFVVSKRIPVRGGLGGGSSDAATALVLAERAWGLDVLPADLRAIAPRLGADVPFFLAGHDAALVEGIGETIEPLPAPSTPIGVVLVTQPGGASTAGIFAAYDAGPPPDATAREHVDALARRFRAGLSATDLVASASSLRAANDLWSAAVRLDPSLVRLRDELEGATGRPFLLTGSGSTLFGLLASPDEAAPMAERLVRDRPAGVRHATVIATATAPVAPAGATPRGGRR